MILVNIHEAKTNLSKLIAKVEETGETIRICRNGKAVVDLGPVKKKWVDRLKPHPELSKIKIMYDPTEALTEDEWSEEYR